MSNFDFNNAEPQRAMGELIPENTIVLVVAKVRPGGEGPDGWLKGSATGAQMLDMEFTIDGGEFDRRKVWENWVVGGVTDGHEKASAISRSRLRALLESARGINPSDDSASAMEGRCIESWGDLDGMTFCAKIGIETGGLKDKMAGPQSDRYADKNKLKAILTPADADYIAPGGPPPVAGMKTAGQAVHRAAAAAGGATAKAAAAAKPSWAA